jgi:electron transport complex protein RnfG
MKTGFKMFAVLTFITVLSGGLLAGLDSVTAPKIKEHQSMELKAAISEVLPPHDFYQEIPSALTTLYVAKNKEREEPVGIAFRIIGSGFQGKLSIMIGVKPAFNEITGMKVLEQVETPGLGTKIVVDPSNKSNPFWFSEQFKGLTVEPEITIIKNVKPTKNTEIQAISGATISSKAVVRILNENIRKAKEIYQANKD